MNETANTPVEFEEYPPVAGFDGYVDEIAYTYNYFSFLSPASLQLALLSQSISFPTRRPLRYLELGCGNGISLNIHAASNLGEYWGIDLNPRHTAFAGKLAKFSGAEIRNISFADLLAHTDLPDFDIVVAHGVWSYLSEGSQNVILEFLGRKLSDGGIFFVSYNALPGWAPILPLQRLLWARAQTGNRKHKIQDRLAAGLRLASELRGPGNCYYSDVPTVVDHLQKILDSDPAYLCHEYLCQRWNLLSFFDASRLFSRAGLTFVGSASLTDHFPELVFNSENLKLIDSADDPDLRETVADILLNKWFRKDIFIKNGRPLTRPERDNLLLERSVVLARPAGEVDRHIETPTGAFDLGDPPFDRILAGLAEHRYRPRKLRELLSDDVAGDAGSREWLRAIFMLIQARIILVTHENQSGRGIQNRCHNLNNAILGETAVGNFIPALASPVAGCGFKLDRAQLLFVQAKAHGRNSPEEWAAFAREIDRPDELRTAAPLLAQALRFSQWLPCFTALELTSPRSD